MIQKYTLITPQGKVIAFNVLACAITFQQAYGGTIVTDSITLEEVIVD
jgi:hypothetical protein